MMKHNQSTRSASKSSFYEPLSFFQVRTPLFPIEAYPALSPATEAGKQSLAIGNPSVQRALAIGSLDLLDDLQDTSRSSKDRLRRERSLLHYFIRMSARPTPYGLFAGVALASWGEKTNLALADPSYSIHTRPDMGWLLMIIEQLEATLEVRRHLRFVTNTAAYRRGERIFLQDPPLIGGLATLRAFSLKATSAITHALDLARQPITYADLMKGLLSFIPEATPAAVEDLVTLLWRYAFLISDLRPSLKVDDPARAFKERLMSIPPAAQLLQVWEDYLESIAAWDAAPERAGVALYRDLVKKAESIETLVDQQFRQQHKGRSADAAGLSPKGQKSSTLLQVDAVLHLSEREVTKSLGEEMAYAAELILRLGGISEKFSLLQEYREVFREKYGVDREVPLLELTDTQFGKGISSAQSPHSPRNTHTYGSPRREGELLHLALSALQSKQIFVQLDEEQIKRLEMRPLTSATMPASLDMYASVTASSAQALDCGDYLVIIGPRVGTPCAGQSLGRFAFMLGSEAQQVLAEIREREMLWTPDAIPVEIVHLPRDGRMANLVISPTVHNYQILHGVIPEVAGPEVIPLDELVIGLRNERLYVRWPRQNKDILIRAGHLLRSYQDPEVIKFLLTLAEHQVAPPFYFDWGNCQNFPFLPRIQVGRIVLSLARWYINSSLHLEEFNLDTSDNFFQALARWRERWNVPRYVYLSKDNLVEREERLLLNLTDPAHVEEIRISLLQAPERARLLLEEAIPGPEHAWLEGPGGHYLSEFVIPLVQRAPKQNMKRSEAVEISSSPMYSSHQADVDATRLYFPGSEWLFVKLYCPPMLQNDLITGPIRDFCQNMQSKSLFDEWFFIRYTDPDPHIRLRFHGDRHILTNKLMPEVCCWANQLVAEGYCLKFSFDVYEREIERYGGPHGIPLAETLFYADSIAVADMLRLRRGQGLDLDLHSLTIYSINDFLASLDLSLSMRLSCFTTPLSKQRIFGKEYRQKSMQLRSLLGDPEYLKRLTGGEELAAILATRRTRLSSVAQQLSQLTCQGIPTERMNRIYRSLIHMHCNRLLGMDRQVEHKIIEFLLRTWTGLERAPLS